MNDQLTTAIENDEVDLSDTSASDIRDDYEAFKRFLAEQNEPLPSMATTGLPGGGIAFKKGAFPWVASGRSLSLGRDEGFTKVLFDPETHRVLGAGIVGPNAGELIAELALAIEMGADATDIGLTVHPHPTLSETVGLAAEAFEGTLTDLYIPKR